MKSCVDCGTQFQRGSKAVRCAPCAAHRKFVKNKERSAKWAAAHPERMREHKRLWSKLNPDKVNAQARAYYKKNSEKLKARFKAWRDANREKYKACRKACQQRHREKHLAGKRRRGRAEYERSREQVLARTKRWVQRHPETAKRVRQLVCHRRRVALTGDGRTLTKEQWANVQAQYAVDGVVMCAYCKKRPGNTLDHVIPIARGGWNAPDNVLPACMTCNASKGTKLLSEWTPRL